MGLEGQKGPESICISQLLSHISNVGEADCDGMPPFAKPGHTLKHLTWISPSRSAVISAEGPKIANDVTDSLTTKVQLLAPSRNREHNCLLCLKTASELIWLPKHERRETYEVETGSLPD